MHPFFNVQEFITVSHKRSPLQISFHFKFIITTYYIKCMPPIALKFRIGFIKVGGFPPEKLILLLQKQKGVKQCQISLEVWNIWGKSTDLRARRGGFYRFQRQLAASSSCFFTVTARKCTKLVGFRRNS